jgi:large subunit ribosomal protein L28
MPRCELTQKGPVVANLVSHSNIKTKSISQPNIQYKKLHSQALQRSFTLKVATSTIRTIEHRGGFDGYLLNQPNELLSKKALEIKKKIKHKLHAKKSGSKS